MKIIEINFAFFLNINKRIDYSKINQDIQSSIDRSFSDAPQIINFPENAPAEIPRFHLNTLDNKFRISMSPIRLDVAFVAPVGSIGGEQISEFLEDCKKLYSILRKISSIDRFGFVHKSYLVSKDPVFDMKTSLFNSEVGDIFESQIRFVRMLEHDGLKYNNSFSFENGFKLDTKENIVLFQKDINTKVDQSNLSNDQLNSSCELFLKDSKNIIDKMDLSEILRG